VAERELDAALHTYEPKGASLVVVDPMTGEILALASSPGYNPNDYSDSDPEARRDRAVTDRFEPGSVMKPFLIAGALNAGSLKPTETIDCEHGSSSWRAFPSTTRTSTTCSRHADPGDELQHRVAQDRPAARGAGALRELPALRLRGGDRRPAAGETGECCAQRPAVVQFETATASFGQGISVSTMQLAMAMSAIATAASCSSRPRQARDRRQRRHRARVEHARAPRGRLRRACADRGRDADGRHREEEGGTGWEAAIPGFRVAGKTSTAEKVDPVTHAYSKEKYTAVFVGSAGRPSADRRRVVLDEPTIGHYGGDLAGPVFRRVAESLALPRRDAAGRLGEARPGQARGRSRGRDARDDEAARAARPAAAAVGPASLPQGACVCPMRAACRARRRGGADEGGPRAADRGLGSRRASDARARSSGAQGERGARGARARVMTDVQHREVCAWTS